jgi:hypothetical protein
VLELAAGLLAAGFVLVLGGRMPPRFSFAGLSNSTFAARGNRRVDKRDAPEDVLPSNSAPPRDYRVVIPGVGAFATLAEAESFIEERSRARRHTSAGPDEERAGYRVVRTEFGTCVSARNGPVGAGE